MSFVGNSPLNISHTTTKKSLTKDSLHQNKNNGKEVLLDFFLYGNK